MKRYNVLFIAICACLASLAPASMAADITGPRSISWRNGDRVALPVASNQLIYAGALVNFDLATLTCANASDRTTNAVICVGAAVLTVDQTGSNYASNKLVEIRRGIVAVERATSAITRAYIGQVVYVSDNQTITTGSPGANTAAGYVVDVDDDGTVWLDTRLSSADLDALVAGSLAVTANASVGGTLGVTGNTTLTANAAIGGTLDVTGSSTVAALTASGNVTAPAYVVLGTTTGRLDIAATGVGTNSLVLIIGSTTNVVKENVQ